MTENCVGYLNLDNLAIQGTTVPGVEGQPEMKDLLTEDLPFCVFSNEILEVEKVMKVRKKRQKQDQKEWDQIRKEREREDRKQEKR